MPYHFVGKKTFCRLRGWVPYKMGGHDPTGVIGRGMKNDTQILTTLIFFRWVWGKDRQLAGICECPLDFGDFNIFNPSERRPVSLQAKQTARSSVSVQLEIMHLFQCQKMLPFRNLGSIRWCGAYPMFFTFHIRL